MTDEREEGPWWVRWIGYDTGWETAHVKAWDPDANPMSPGVEPTRRVVLFTGCEIAFRIDRKDIEWGPYLGKGPLGSMAGLVAWLTEQAEPMSVEEIIARALKPLTDDIERAYKAMKPKLTTDQAFAPVLTIEGADVVTVDDLRDGTETGPGTLRGHRYAKTEDMEQSGEGFAGWAFDVRDGLTQRGGELVGDPTIEQAEPANGPTVDIQVPWRRQHGGGLLDSMEPKFTSDDYTVGPTPYAWPVTPEWLPPAEDLKAGIGGWPLPDETMERDTRSCGLVDFKKDGDTDD